jgi:hypothetical protein
MTTPVPPTPYPTSTPDRVVSQGPLGVAVTTDFYQVGMTVEVFYDPANPQDFFLNDFVYVTLTPAVTAGLAGVSFLVGLGLLVAGLRSGLGSVAASP